MKVLIIGGTGNISTPITRELVERGDEVILYNRGSSKVEGARCILGQRKNYEEFESQIKKEGYFDCVIDMIAYDISDTESALRAFKGRTEQYIFCSTVDVYTKPAKSYPVTENAERSPDPVFTYAYNKAKCETILEAAHARNDINLTILRPAATYSPEHPPIALLGDGYSLLKRIRNQKPIIVMGDGTSFWSSSINTDVAHAFVNAVKNPKTYGKAYHITGDEFITWRQYYQTIAAVMGVQAPAFVPIPTDILGRIAPTSAAWCVMNFMYHNIFDNSKAKEDLGYQYTVTWEEGVRQMIKNLDSSSVIDNSQDFPLYDEILHQWSGMTDALTKNLSALDI